MRKNYFLFILAILFTVNAMAQNIPSYVPKDGLVGFWPFNGNANDESGNGNHGTVNGATLTSDRNGVANSAYNFDGNDDFIDLGDMSNYLDNINHFTLSFWVNTNLLFNEFGGAKNGGVFSHWSYNERTTDAIGIISSINPEGNSNNSVIGGNGITSSAKITPNQNENVTISFNGSTVYNERFKLYINGIFSQYLNFGNSFTQFGNRGNKTIIGGIVGPDFPNNVYGNFKGIIDDIAIYNRALSEQEIKKLYEGCSKETATSSSFNSLLFTNGTAVSITAEPQGGVFSGASIENNQFIPSKAKIGSNKVKYNFKNSKGCADSTIFNMVVADTVGASCTKYDTIKVTKFDTVTVKNNVYDTVTVTNNVTKYDTVTFTNNVTKYDTVIVKTNVFDTVKVTKYDTLKVTKFDTVTVKNNIYDTVTIKNNVFDTVKVTKYDTLTVTNNVTKYDTVIINKTKFDTVIVKTNVFDTVKVTKYDTLTITKNVTKYDTVIINKTKYDTVIVNKTKYDTITIKNNVFDTVKVTKYDTLTVKNNIYDTVSILKIKFKLTTGISANQLSSLSIYPNPTSDVLHIEVPDAKALEGYRYRIVDVLGKEVYNQLVTQTTTEIPLKTLGAAGIYHFEILDAKNASIQSNKIVLQ